MKNLLYRFSKSLALPVALFLAMAALEPWAQAASPCCQITAITLTPTQVTGGTPVTATVRLTGPDRSPIAVSLSSSNKAVAAVPTSIKIPAGAASAEFAITTSPVEGPEPVSVVITASQYMKGIPSMPSTGRTVVTKTSALTVLPPVVRKVGIAENRGVIDFGSRGCKPNAARTGGVPTHGCVILTGPAPSGRSHPGLPIGGAVVRLSSSNIAVAAVPATVTVPAGKTEQTFIITTVPVTTASSAVISADRSPSDAKQATLTVIPPALSSFGCSPTSFTGGTVVVACTVSLTGPAYTGGVNVALSSSNAVARLPDRNGITVVAGQSAANFAITTVPVVNPTPVTITASFAGVTKQATLTVMPPVLNSFGCSPTSLMGSNPVTCTVSLTGKVASGAVANVALSSDSAAAPVPASVPVPAGAASATVTVQTNSVASQTHVTLKASYGGVTKQVTLTLSAPPKPDLYINNVSYFDTSGSGINSPRAGQAFTMCINVVNGGGATADSNKLRVKLHESGVVNDIQTWDKDLPALNPHTGATPCIDVPALSANHSYDFNIYVDVDNGVDESNENNNYGHVGFGF